MPGGDRARARLGRLELAALSSLLSSSLLACATSVYVPRAPLTPTRDEPYREKPPAELPPSASRAPAVEQVVLANGMRVVIVRRGSLPVAVVRYVSREAGSASAPAGKFALPELTLAALVGGGTALDDGTEMRDVHLGGMPIGTRIEDVIGSLQLRVGAAGVERAIELLAQTVARPTFTELSPVAHELASELVATWNRVARVEDRLLYALLCGQQDVRAAQPRAWMESLRGLDAAALRAWHARYRPESSLLVVVGQVDPSAVRAAAERTFGAWRPTSTPPAAAPTGSDASTASPGVHVLLSGSQPSVVSLAWRTVAPSHPDYWATELLSSVLAGTPITPTWMELRHRTGLSYGVQARVIATHADGQLRVTTMAPRAELGAVLKVLDAQIERVLRGIPEGELETARRALLSQLDLSAETNAQVALTLEGAFAVGDPLEVLARGSEHVRALSAAELAKVAARYLDRARRVLLITGDHPPGDSQLRGLRPHFHALQ
jgi:zinc protease